MGGRKGAATGVDEGIDRNGVIFLFFFFFPSRWHGGGCARLPDSEGFEGGGGAQTKKQIRRMDREPRGEKTGGNEKQIKQNHNRRAGRARDSYSIALFLFMAK